MTFGSHSTLMVHMCSNSFDVLTGCCTISCQGLVLAVMQRIKQFLLALTTKHDKCIIEKENNFKQPGERYRSWAPGQLVWYIGYLVVLLLQARKKDLPAVELRSLSISQVTHETHRSEFFPLDVHLVCAPCRSQER